MVRQDDERARQEEDARRARIAAAAQRFAPRPVAHGRNLRNRADSTAEKLVGVSPEPPASSEDLVSSAPTAVPSPTFNPSPSACRYQIFLLRSRLDASNAFIIHAYPQYMWRASQVETIYLKFIDALPPASDIESAVMSDMSPDFVFRYSSLQASLRPEPDDDSYGDDLDDEQFSDLLQRLMDMRSRMSILVRLIPMYPPNGVFVLYCFLEHMLINMVRTCNV
ncbi:hypothetical protein DFH06DRAFT_1318547 [Mycena polygramma]|nr:hypothetical protein DFH06DRAFT_1318547 [Mycena polygramma]